MKDVWNCPSSTEYVNIIVTATKRCSQSKSKFRNVMQVWIHINLSLQKAIDESSLSITVRQFMSILQSKQSNWYDEFSQHHHESINHDHDQQNQQSDRNHLFQNFSFSNQTFISRFSTYSYCSSYFDNCRFNRPAFSYASYVSYDRSSYSGQFSIYNNNYEQSNNHQQKQNCRADSEDLCCQIISSQ